MKYVIWKLAGGDCEILEISGEDSQRSFWIIGILYLVIGCIVYLAFLGLFAGVFKNALLTIVASFVLGFLVTNIYRINIMSLRPQSLPVKVETGSLILSHSIRYITVVMFAFFVSKCFEMIVVGFFEKMEIIPFNGTDEYMNHMIDMNTSQPWIWIITVAMLILFIAPVYLRHRLDRAHEYYSLKERRDIRLVLENYNEFKEHKKRILTEVYQNYSTVGLSKLYKEPAPQYEDEPFNTDRIEVKRELHTSSDFLHDILGH